MSRSATPWTVAHQAPLSVGIFQARILEWAAMPSSRGSFQPRDQTQVLLHYRKILYQEYLKQKNKSVSWKKKMVKITFEDQNKVKGMKRTEDSLRDLWDHIKCTNIQIIEVSEELRGKEMV